MHENDKNEFCKVNKKLRLLAQEKVELKGENIKLSSYIAEQDHINTKNEIENIKVRPYS